MQIGTVKPLNNSMNALLNGNGILQGAKTSSDKAKFSDLVKNLQRKETKNESTLSSSQINESGRLYGDYSQGFSNSFTRESDRNALPAGAARNQANPNVKQKTIDKTSRLYEKSLELESYFVKQMLSAMRKTVSKSALGADTYAGEIYEDMLYDEYALSMTKNAGFGLADQIYLSLV